MYCKNCGNQMNDEAAVCTNCGVPAGKGNGFCPSCGAAVNPEAVLCVNCGSPLKKTVNSGKVQKREIVKAILLSIVTCGIYGIYWFIKITDELNELTGNQNDTSGGMSLLLTLVTCGIYGIYWAYKMGTKCDALQDKKGGYSNILYLVLSLFGLSFVVYILVQDAINKAVEK